MARKTKASSRSHGSKGPKELDATDARLAPISTYEDIADAQDEYFLSQDRIVLDEEPEPKKQTNEDEDMDFSDEEILGLDDSESDDQNVLKPKQSMHPSRGEEEDEVAIDAEDERDPDWWGSSKKEYYDADNIETEADALEEEAEAKRLQQKKLSKMREEDFVFDGDEWLAAESGVEGSDDNIFEILEDNEVTPDMTDSARLQFLTSRYPEFGHFASELCELHPVLLVLEGSAAEQTGASIELIQYWALGCYVAALTSYFAIFSSRARDSSTTPKPLSPTELRDHDIMETLLSARAAWSRVKNLRTVGDANKTAESLVAEMAEMEFEYAPDDSLAPSDSKMKKGGEEKDSVEEESAGLGRQARKIGRAGALESSLANLYNLPRLSGNTRRKTKLASMTQADDSSDFGEEDALRAGAAAEKAARKRSLKFYTSQIAQKANKRAGAGREAGGDMDIPHRERLRDRQARLLAEAERRGKRDSKHGADLDDDSDGPDAAAADAIRGEGDDYYDMIAQTSKAKREDKAARYAAYAAASKADRVIENEEIGEDGKRKITYAIEKNKGLAPKRSKDVRNPRVKRRKQYEAKQKKLKSMKPVWQGGEPKGGYRGELSGVNTGVVKSIKL